MQEIPGGKRGKEGEDQKDRICVPYLSLALSSHHSLARFVGQKIQRPRALAPRLSFSRALSPSLPPPSASTVSVSGESVCGVGLPVYSVCVHASAVQFRNLTRKACGEGLHARLAYGRGFRLGS